MNSVAISIRPFVGSQDFDLCRQFYRDLGFEETRLGDAMSVFHWGQLSFYLQKAYVKDWVDNTMVFMEVESVDGFWEYLVRLKLPEKYEGARLVPTRVLDWGKECFLHDPSGVLWHFGEFTKG